MTSARDDDRTQEVRRQADATFLRNCEPELRAQVDEQSSALRLEGSVVIERSDGRLFRIAVSVRYPGRDPRELPDVYDVDGRFPPDPVRHVESTGRFCLWLPPLAPRTRFAEIDGLAFLLGRIRDFLERQLIYERRRMRGTRPFWPGPEWDHGDAGYDQWVRELLGDLEVGRLENALDAVVRMPLARGRPCVCGSGRRYGSCHLKRLAVLQRAWSDPHVKAACERLRKEVRARARSSP